MATEEDIRASLNDVVVPEAERSILALNLVKEIAVSGGRATIELASTALSEGVRDYVDAGIRAVVSKQQVRDLNIVWVEAKPSDLNEVRHVIAVMSGKGGVGKSAVTSLLAVALRRLGNEVGILDADITGSSIPRMLGVRKRPIGSETGLLPVATESGIAVMSMNLLVPEEGSAVIWRAPLLSGAIKQFWTDVVWGKLDYLLVDLPPGTADAPLTVLQTLPVEGIVLVTTPQGLVEMIVRKAVDMARKMGKRVLGIVENMSYFYVPELDRRYELFGPSKAADVAKDSVAPVLARLPIDPELARLCDEGKIEDYRAPYAAALGEALIKAIRGTPGAEE